MIFYLLVNGKITLSVIPHNELTGAYDTLLKRRGSLMVWLDFELQWQASPIWRAGWSTFSTDAAIQF